MLTVRFYDIEWICPTKYDYIYQSTHDEWLEYYQACDDFAALPEETIFELDDDYHTEYDVESAPEHLSEIYGFYVKSVKVEWIS
jgi:hypothetical protein